MALAIACQRQTSWLVVAPASKSEAVPAFIG
jgi:hypothetical protein